MGNEQPDSFSKILHMQHVCSAICNELISDNYAVEPRGLMWEDILNCEIDLKHFHKYYSNIYQITNYSKLRSFQYLLIQHAITTNKDLLKYKIRTDSLCSFCHSNTEAIMHLLVKCEYVKLFYNDVAGYTNEVFPNTDNINVQDPKNIVFNQI